MVHIGIDLHKRESQICWLDGDTGEVRHQRIQTRSDRFQAVLRSPRPADVLIEASTESEWVAACVAELGHRVHVVDPSYAPMYPGARRRRHKNDTRDAVALATASLRGTYREVHRPSAVRREVRQVITVRESVVRTRTRLICVVRAALRSNGLRVASGSPQRFAGRVRQVPLSPALAEAIGPVLLLLEILGDAGAAAGHAGGRLYRTGPRHATAAVRPARRADYECGLCGGPRHSDALSVGDAGGELPGSCAS